MATQPQSELDKVFSDDFDKKQEEKIAEKQTEVLPKKEEPKQQQAQKKNELMSMEIKDGGMVVSNMEQKVAMIQAAIKGGMLPKRYTEVGMVLSGLQYSHEIGLGGTLVSLKNIAIVEGTPTLYNEAPLALCSNSGKLEYIKEYYLDKEQKEISAKNGNMFSPPEMAVCEVKRFGDSEPLITFFGMNDASKAGLIGRGVWSKYPKLMMKYRARSEALKGKFPDVTNGISIGEYDFHGVDEKTSQKEEREKSDINDLVFKKEEN